MPLTSSPRAPFYAAVFGLLLVIGLAVLLMEPRHAPIPGSSVSSGTVPAPADPLPSVMAPADVPTRITLTGTYECLPHRDTSGPVTMECAFGLKTDAGEHYALNTTAVSSDLFFRLEVGTRVAVEGVFVPIEQISAASWQKYDVKGIVQVASASVAK